MVDGGAVSFDSEPGAQMKKMVEDQLKVKILGPTFFGTRHVGLKPKKKISTAPATVPRNAPTLTESPLSK